MCVCAFFPFEACMTIVMDDEKELINTKSLSVWLHPNFPQHVCTVIQQQTRAELCVCVHVCVCWGGGVIIRWGETSDGWINEAALLAEVGTRGSTAQPYEVQKETKWKLSGGFSSCHIRFWALLEKVTQGVIHHPQAGKTVCTHCGPETRIIHPVPTGLFSPPAGDKNTHPWRFKMD